MNIRLPALALSLALCVPVAARADMYKRVDENGKVSYTNVPPPDLNTAAKATLLTTGMGNVSTYSSAESLGKGASRGTERQLKERIGQLERELEIERRARTLAREMVSDKAAQDAQKLREKRERCIADRRTDCDQLELEAGNPVHRVVVARAPQVIRQVIVHPVVIRSVLVPRPSTHHPHNIHAHGLTQAMPGTTTHLSATLGRPPHSGVARTWHHRQH